MGSRKEGSVVGILLMIGWLVSSFFGKEEKKTVVVDKTPTPVVSVDETPEAPVAPTVVEEPKAPEPEPVVEPAQPTKKAEPAKPKKATPVSLALPKTYTYVSHSRPRASYCGPNGCSSGQTYYQTYRAPPQNSTYTYQASSRQGVPVLRRFRGRGVPVLRRFRR